MADRPADRHRIWKEGARRRPTDAVCRQIADAECLRFAWYVPVELPRMGSPGTGVVLRLRRCTLSSPILRERASGIRRVQSPVRGDEPDDGSTDRGGSCRLRPRPWTEEICEAALAIFRRVERLVPRA